jgi:hypothetical protein
MLYWSSDIIRRNLGVFGTVKLIMKYSSHMRLFQESNPITEVKGTSEIAQLSCKYVLN